MIRITAKTTGLGRIAVALNRWGSMTEKAVDQAVLRSGQYLRKQWIMGIRSQAPGGRKFKPLAQSTIDAKGSSKALIDQGDMIRSINVQKVQVGGKGIVVFVGIHRTVVSRDGKSMANLAEIHETGSLKVKNRPPARPHMAPSWRVWKQHASKQFAADVARKLGLQSGISTAIIGGVGGLKSTGGSN